MEGVDSSRNETRYRWLVVANDATKEVSSDHRITVDWQNENSNEHYIARVYRAWNEGVLNAATQWVILLNNDMAFSDWAIDELIEQKRLNRKSLPCSLLVENGRIPSGMPDFVKDFGTTPETFRMDDFRRHADGIRVRGQVTSGKLYQPVLLDRQEFFDLAGYPDGNVGGISGDKILFQKYVDADLLRFCVDGSEIRTISYQ